MIGWCDLGSDGHPYQKQVWVVIRYLPAIKVNRKADRKNSLVILL